MIQHTLSIWYLYICILTLCEYTMINKTHSWSNDESTYTTPVWGTTCFSFPGLMWNIHSVLYTSVLLYRFCVLSPSRQRPKRFSILHKPKVAHCLLLNTNKLKFTSACYLAQSECFKLFILNTTGRNECCDQAVVVHSHCPNIS